MMKSSVIRWLSVAFVVVMAVGAFAPRAHAQFSENLHLYGFFQGQYRYSNGELMDGPTKISSFSVQQLNAYLAKEFSPSFSAFVGAELTNTFSTRESRGSLKLEEAWLRYNQSAAFNVKAGLLAPTFNNLNEVKNRTPMLPYVFRPIAYESSFAGILDMEAMVPQQAFVQVYGAVPVGQARIDYAAYMGNNDNSYTATQDDGLFPSGTDTTMHKLFGGRLGLRYNSLKAGVSASTDHRSMNQVRLFGTIVVPMGLGDVGRTRIGADASFSVGRFFGEAELIRVLYDLDDEQEATLTFLASNPNSPVAGLLTNDPDITFYYALLGVNVTEQVFAYGMYNDLADGMTVIMADGLEAYGVGAGYRPIDPVTIKAQYMRATLPGTAYGAGMKTNELYMAVSVFF